MSYQGEFGRDQCLVLSAGIWPMIDSASIASDFSCQFWFRVPNIISTNPLFGGQYEAPDFDQDSGFRITIRAGGVIRIRNHFSDNDRTWDTLEPAVVPNQWMHFGIRVRPSIAVALEINGASITLTSEELWGTNAAVPTGYAIGNILQNGAFANANFYGEMEDFTFNAPHLTLLEQRVLYQGHLSGLTSRDVKFHFALNNRAGLVSGSQPPARDSITRAYPLVPNDSPVWAGSTPGLSYPLDGHVMPHQEDVGASMLLGDQTKYSEAGEDTKTVTDGTRRVGAKPLSYWVVPATGGRHSVLANFDTEFGARAAVLATYDVPFSLRYNLTFEHTTFAYFNIGARFDVPFGSRQSVLKNYDTAFGDSYYSTESQHDNAFLSVHAIGRFDNAFGDAHITYKTYAATIEFQVNPDGTVTETMQGGPGIYSVAKVYDASQYDSGSGDIQFYDFDNVVNIVYRDNFELDSFDVLWGDAFGLSARFEHWCHSVHAVIGDPAVRIYRNDGTEDGLVDYDTLYKEVLTGQGLSVATDPLGYPMVWKFGLRHYNGLYEELNITEQRRLELDADGFAVENRPPVPHSVAIDQIGTDGDFYVKVQADIEVMLQPELPVPTHVELRQRLPAGYLQASIELPLTFTNGRAFISYVIEDPNLWFQSQVSMALGVRSYYEGVSGIVYSLMRDSNFITPDREPTLTPRQVVLRAV